MPPPTVNGTKRSRAARRTVSASVLRPSDVAVMSSNTISSAPADAWASASSAGSPASRSCWNRMPFTTRPASTSRQAMILLASRSEGTEVLQDFPPRRSGFFRMKLHAKNIVALHCSGKCFAVLRAGYGTFHHRRAKRVCVIDKRTVFNIAEQPRAAADLNLVPADVRRLDRSREARTLSSKECCAGRFRRFCAALKQPLHAHADSQKRLAAGNTLKHRGPQLLI